MENKYKKYRNDRDLLQFIINQSSCAIIVIDKDEEVITTNKEHEQLTGYPTKYLTGMTLTEMIDKKIIHDAATRKVMKRRETVVFEQLSENYAHQELACMVKAVPYFDEAGEIEYVICYLFNISEKRKLIEELTASNLKFSMELLQLKNDTVKKLGIVYRSQQMKKIIEKAEIIAKTDSAALILGESGVGKSLFARFLHNNSQRKEKTFLTINCGAVPDALMESELFGYEKGAFTGAGSQGKKGLVELTDGGTLFLDEIGDMPYNLQVKLLRFLQEKEFFRIGGTKAVKVNTRVIAATNADLKEKIKEKKFREDLYYRLNVLELNIPALRDRKEDIPVLVECFRSKLNEAYQLKKEISQEVITVLMELELKGNVRELEHIVERLLLFSSGKVIGLEDVYEIVEDNTGSHLCADFRLGSRTYKQMIEEVEKEIFAQAKQLYHSTTEIGRQLKIDQSTVSRKLRKYHL